MKKDQIRKVEIKATTAKKESINAIIPDKQVVQRVVVGSDVRH